METIPVPLGETVDMFHNSADLLTVATRYCGAAGCHGKFQ